MPEMGSNVPYLGSRLYGSAQGQPRDRAERKQDQLLPRYKNPLQMRDRPHRLLALYHSVEPGYLSLPFPPRHHSTSPCGLSPLSREYPCTVFTFSTSLSNSLAEMFLVLA